MITVEQTGPLALFQDLGRPGLAHLGVTASGAADRAALRLANRLLGNPEHTAAIEITLGGLEITSDRPLWFVVTGAPTTVSVDDHRHGSHHSLALAAGQRLSIAPPPRGLRNYLAVRGGFEVTSVLGSASTDLLSGLGPEPLARGDQLAVGVPTGPLPSVAFAPPPDPVTELLISSGPRRDWFTDQAWSRLVSTEWQVSPESNRVGVRLTGPRLERSVSKASEELPSEPILVGAVQVPASGQPLIFGPDHPLTGGYPVIAVLSEDARDAAGQLRGGDRVRLIGR